jgi:hypothetical protein
MSHKNELKKDQVYRHYENKGESGNYRIVCVTTNFDLQGFAIDNLKTKVFITECRDVTDGSKVFLFKSDNNEIFLIDAFGRLIFNTYVVYENIKTEEKWCRLKSDFMSKVTVPQFDFISDA